MTEIESLPNQVALLRLRHGKVNALDTSFCRHLIEQLDHIESSGKYRSIVLTGQGKCFSAGVDLPQILKGGASYVDEFLPAMMDFFFRLFKTRIPTVAAINGHAIAGGWVIAVACDYRIIPDDGSQFGLSELQVGIPFPIAALEIVRHTTPRQYLQELIYGADLYGARDAQARGLGQIIVDPSEVLSHAIKVAEKWGRIPSKTFALTKSQFQFESLACIEKEAPRTNPEIFGMWKTPEAMQTIKRFVERFAK